MNPDIYANSMKGIIEGFQLTLDELNHLKKEQEALKAQQNRLEARQQNIVRATYSAATASGKGRFVSALVEDEKKNGPGAQARVAKNLGISSVRVSQVLHAEKNRQNGK